MVFPTLGQIMKRYEKRITASFLWNCSPEKAYEWLSKNWEVPKVGGFRGFARAEFDSARRPLEYLLYRRNDPLIDIGLAQYGYVSSVLKRVFRRGDSGVRCAILASPALLGCGLLQNDPIVNLSAVLEKGHFSELEALASNPYMNTDFYENLLNRQKYFAELTDKNFKIMVYHLGDNPRLATEYDEDFFDGWADYHYNRIFKTAWELAANVPATQEWAYILNHFLSDTVLPFNLDNKTQVIDRWRIDPPKENNDSYYVPPNSFYLRSRLADLLEANDELLNSPDLALRRSFYRRFLPWDYKDWPDFLKKDGEEFLETACWNPKLWSNQTERKKLSALAWDCPDPHSDMQMPNLYKGRESYYRKEHPEWFYEEDDEFSSEPDAINRQTNKLLTKIDKKLENLMFRTDEKQKKWW